MPTTAPYGSWPSPLTASTLADGARRMTELQADGDELSWLQSRPDEGGRQVVMRWRDGEVVDVSPEGFNARSRVHEYGGGAHRTVDGVVFASDWDDQRLYRQDGPDAQPRPITPEPDRPAGLRYADVEVAPDGAWLVCVRERIDGDGEVHNELVRLPTDGSSPPSVVIGDSDFVAAPRLSPDGSRLAWLSWDHPRMPWDGTVLRVAELSADGSLAEPTVVAGGADEAVLDPTWLPDGDLLFATDRTGWWNVHRWDGATDRPLTELDDGDLGRPLWQLGRNHLVPLPDGRVAGVLVRRARAHLVLLDPDEGGLVEVEQPLTAISSIATRGERIVLLGGGPDVELAILEVDATTGAVDTIAQVTTPGLTPQWAPQVEPVTFPTPDGAEAHAFLYRPTHPELTGPATERPPLVVFTHGGPTGNVFPTLAPSIAYWTSRGVAVVDVNYRGSTGYGRAYRDALKGNWGLHDVADAIAAATALAERGEVDPDRLAIRGGSAGGFTTLAALTATEHPFSAGCNLFGVSDVAALAEHTHKFESRYLDQLIGPYPQEAERYRQRSPITHVHRLRTPLLVLQGDEDVIVPPAQSEVIVEAARAQGVPHAYLLFEGEQHGFRKAENITRALEAELAFYGEMLGFEPADDIPPVPIVHGSL